MNRANRLTLRDWLTLYRAAWEHDRAGALAVLCAAGAMFVWAMVGSVMA